MNELKDLIRSNFRRYRQQANLSQVDLAKKLQVRPSAVSNWENGRNSIDIDTLFKVCKLYGISIDKMTEDPEIVSMIEEDEELKKLGTEILNIENDKTLSNSRKYNETEKIKKKAKQVYFEKYQENAPAYGNQWLLDPLIGDLVDRLNEMKPRQRAKVVDAIMTLLDSVPHTSIDQNLD